jgi:AraC family transcriptional regulator
MQCRIEVIQPKLLVGMSQRMSHADNQTKALWQRFMPRRGEVMHRVTNDYISMQVRDPATGDWFLSTASFEKWALVEVNAADSIPYGMHQYRLQGGQYAVFLHKGPASDYAESMRYILGEWMPDSGFEPDQREHFEILPEGYDPFDPEAEEEIWVPVRCNKQ